MFGDILSDAASVLPGSLGLMPLAQQYGLGPAVRWNPAVMDMHSIGHWPFLGLQHPLGMDCTCTSPVVGAPQTLQAMTQSGPSHIQWLGHSFQMHLQQEVFIALNYITWFFAIFVYPIVDNYPALAASI